VKSKVLPSRKAAAEKESARNKITLAKNPDAKVNIHHANFLKQWWQLSYGREDMVKAIGKLSRYIVCGRVTKRPIFAFVERTIRPNDALQVFAYDDDYTFGILQSSIHWQWFVARCSTLKADPRYTSNTVWDSFPWPQKPTKPAITRVAAAAVAFRELRSQLAQKHNRSLRDLYRSLEMPGKNPLKDAQELLDKEVRSAYEMTDTADPLQFLLKLNLKLSAAEIAGETVRSAGIPEYMKPQSGLITTDCIKA